MSWKLKAVDGIDGLSDLFIVRGILGHIRSDSGPKFVAKAVRESITAVGARTGYIKLSSSREKGYCKNFNSRRWDELLKGEIFYILEEAKLIIGSW
jgi:putative transposase